MIPSTAGTNSYTPRAARSYVLRYDDLPLSHGDLRVVALDEAVRWAEFS